MNYYYEDIELTSKTIEKWINDNIKVDKSRLKIKELEIEDFEKIIYYVGCKLDGYPETIYTPINEIKIKIVRDYENDLFNLYYVVDDRKDNITLLNDYIKVSNNLIKLTDIEYMIIKDNDFIVKLSNNDFIKLDEYDYYNLKWFFEKVLKTKIIKSYQ